MEKQFQMTGALQIGQRQLIRLALSICFALYGIVIAYASPSTVKGKVTGTDGYGIAGVNVIEKGTTNGIITDVEGQYILNLTTENPVLVFSFIGYRTEIFTISTITSDSVFYITLVEQPIMLEGAVVKAKISKKEFILQIKCILFICEHHAWVASQKFSCHLFSPCAHPTSLSVSHTHTHLCIHKMPIGQFPRV